MKKNEILNDGPRSLTVLCCFLAVVMSLLCLHQVHASPDPKPNILVIMGDDLTFRDIGPYGNRQVKTPNLDRLAKEGMCLDNMFTSTAMCAPTRQQFLTGMYPVRNGAYPNHSQVYPGTKSVAHHLQAMGYRTALIGKKHFGPASAFPFEYLGGRGHDDGDGQDIDLESAGAFIKDTGDNPYFLMVCSNQTHTPWNRGNPGAYPPESITVPSHLVDTEETRKKLSQYFAEITYLDSLVGVCLEMVEKSGSKNNTIIMFTSEQGSSAPFGKWTCYDSGLKTAFIVKWPGEIMPGSRAGAMTQYVDVVPTIIEMAGDNPSALKTGRKDALGNTGFDGKSFLKVLRGETVRFRDYVFGVHTTRGIINGSEAYPIRSARSDEYLYIQNLNSEAPFSNTEVNSSMYKSWLTTGSQKNSQRALAYTKRPAEELYHVESDPYQLVNLAGDSSLNAVTADLKKQLVKWMAQQGDRGMETEMLAIGRQQKNDNNADAGGKKKKK